MTDVSRGGAGEGLEEGRVGATERLWFGGAAEQPVGTRGHRERMGDMDWYVVATQQGRWWFWFSFSFVAAKVKCRLRKQVSYQAFVQDLMGGREEHTSAQSSGAPDDFFLMVADYYDGHFCVVFCVVLWSCVDVRRWSPSIRGGRW